MTKRNWHMELMQSSTTGAGGWQHMVLRDNLSRLSSDHCVKLSIQF